jgi:hypothetical protein
MKLSTEDLHLLLSRSFMKIGWVKPLLYLRALMNLFLHFLHFSSDKKYFTGAVHKNVFSGCNVRENRCSERHKWGVEL